LSAPPAGATPITEFVSRLTDWLLFALLFLMPITGYLQSADGRAVSFLGLFDLPALPKYAALAHLADDLHLLGQWALYALVSLHAAATVWHVAIRRDRLLDRMIPPQNRGGTSNGLPWLR
jgi:cytochrome b561